MVPNYFRPDAAFLAQVLENIPAVKLLPMKPGSDSTPTVKVINGVKLFGPPAPSSSSPQLAEGDLQWEVVGYHTYNTNGVAPQAANPATKSGSPQHAAGFQSNQTPTQPQTTDIEVEVSDRWPLDRPAAPTGMSCPTGGVGTGLQAVDIDASGNDPNSYVGDRFAVTGKFNLTDSPYASHPNLIDTPGSKCANCLFGQVGQVALDNVFVDWGDGTIESLSPAPTDPNMTNWSRGEGLNLPAPNTTSASKLQAEGVYFHPYNNPGKYTIRVFQLSEADAQHVNASLLSASVDGPANSPFLQVATLGKLVMPGGGATQQNSVGNAFQSVLKQGAMPVALSGGSAPAGSGSNAPAGAYMVFCSNKTLTYPEDLAADGPLHLKSIADPDFPGHDNGPSKLPVHLVH
jgi:hypothetical protein